MPAVASCSSICFALVLYGFLDIWEMTEISKEILLDQSPPAFCSTSRGFSLPELLSTPQPGITQHVWHLSAFLLQPPTRWWRLTENCWSVLLWNFILYSFLSSYLFILQAVRATHLASRGKAGRFTVVLSFPQSSFHFMELFSKGALSLAVTVSADSSWQQPSSSCLTIHLVAVRLSLIFIDLSAQDLNMYHLPWKYWLQGLRALEQVQNSTDETK